MLNLLSSVIEYLLLNEKKSIQNIKAFLNNIFLRKEKTLLSVTAIKTQYQSSIEKQDSLAIIGVKIHEQLRTNSYVILK